MTQDINSILADLYALDPSLKEHEAELVRLIPKLIMARPNVPFSAHFAEELRAQLLATRPHITPAHSWVEMFSLHRYAMGLAFVALVLLVAVPLSSMHKALPNRLNKTAAPKQVAQTYSADKKLAPGAFGLLSVSTVTDEHGERASAQMDVATNQAPLPAQEPSLGATAMLATPPGGGVSGKYSLPMPPMGTRFKYVGAPITLEEKQLDVYRRVKPEASGNVGGVLALTNGLFDAATFAGAKLSNFHLAQTDGYDLDVDVANGSFSLSEHNNGYGCAGMICPAAVEAAPQNNFVPLSDAASIAIANDFIQSHHIDVTHYGAPFVVTNTVSIYNATAKDAPSAVAVSSPVATQAPAPDMALRPIAYVPVVSVVYPLVYNGQAVFEMGGNRAGLEVSVNQTSKKVASLWGAQTQEYQASAYPSQNNAAAIIAYAERGGMNLGYYAGIDTKLELDTPTRGFMKWSTYTTGTVEELLVPALLFPVRGASPLMFGRTDPYVVVPLVSE